MYLFFFIICCSRWIGHGRFLPLQIMPAYSNLSHFLIQLASFWVVGRLRWRVGIATSCVKHLGRSWRQWLSKMGRTCRVGTGFLNVSQDHLLFSPCSCHSRRVSGNGFWFPLLTPPCIHNASENRNDVWTTLKIPWSSWFLCTDGEGQ